MALIPTVFFCSALTPPVMQRTSVRDTAVEIAVADYLECRFSRPFGAFIMLVDEEISEYAPHKISDEVTVIDISPATRRVHITPLVDTLGSVRLPTRHIIKDGKLFYWHDPDYGLTEEMVKVLHEFNIADSIDLLDPNVALDDYTDNYIHHPAEEKAKVAVYYFCREDPSNYKRVITNIATGWYKPPTIRCKQQTKKRVPTGANVM